MKCEEIQAVLFEYMTRELGQARSDLVRTHLLKCSDCKEEAAEIQKTMDLLHAASKMQEGQSGHLSDDRRKKLIMAIKHPVIYWFVTHHIIISIIMTGIALLITLLMCSIKLWSDRSDDGIPVIIIKELPANAQEKGVSEEP